MCNINYIGNTKIVYSTIPDKMKAILSTSNFYHFFGWTQPRYGKYYMSDDIQNTRRRSASDRLSPMRIDISKFIFKEYDLKYVLLPVA